MTSTASEGTAATSGTPVPARAPVDWGVGQYEQVAVTLIPAAEELVTASGICSGERVLDVGCGTGNAALIAARSGARVTGVDPAARLLDIALKAAQEEDLDARFLSGEAASLPLLDDGFDAVLSNFAVIFAPDPAAAITEMVRVLVPGGRIALTAWVPGGVIGQYTSTAMGLVLDVLGAPPPPPPFPWHDRAALAAAFAIHAMTVTTEQHRLAFTDESPEAYLENSRSHPMSVAGLALLQRAGRLEQSRQQLLQILQDGNEDPAAFRGTSSYIVAIATMQ